jgi:hypothetical protein
MEREEETTAAFMSSLLSFTLIAHKYGFSSIERFGFELIIKHCKTYEYPTAGICSTLHIDKLLHLCGLIDDKQYDESGLDECIVNDILHRIEHHSEYEDDMAQLLQIAENFNLRKVLGQVYYRILHSAFSEASASEHCDSDFLPYTPLSLNNAQKGYLQTGFNRLVNASERYKLRGWDAHVRQFCFCRPSPSDSCMSIRAAVLHFAYREASSKVFSFDVLGHFQFMQENCSMLEQNCSEYKEIPPRCHSLILTNIAEMEGACKSEMAEFFLGKLE